MLRLTIVVAWIGDGNPSAIFDSNVFKKVLSDIFKTSLVLKLGQVDAARFGDGNPSTIFDSNVFKKVWSEIFKTSLVLKLGQGQFYAYEKWNTSSGGGVLVSASSLKG
ncbi:hypothetical protein R6Q59_015457 [Mikania micrantha]